MPNVNSTTTITRQIPPMSQVKHVVDNTNYEAILQFPPQYPNSTTLPPLGSPLATAKSFSQENSLVSSPDSLEPSSNLDQFNFVTS